MPTAFINGLAINLPSRFAEGDKADAIALALLNEIQHRRVKSQLRYMLAHGDINPDGLQQRADELMAKELVPHLTPDDDDEAENDPVFKEALSMARELIISRMAAEGLPPPKGIDVHAKALVDGMPDLQEKARARVELRQRIAIEALGSIA